jgi:hypothetical protein
MWRVNTSSTQARQIPFSKAVTDSGGKADKSSGWIGLTGFVLGLDAGFAFRVAAAGFFFAAGDFLSRFDFMGFAGMAATTPSET